MEDFIFSLDIGTRKIAGLIAKMRGDKIHILDCEILEHESRAVRAGQIHDIGEVSKITASLKKTLEYKSGKALKSVSCAIAGRNLKSFKKRGILEFGQSKIVDASLLRDAELNVIQNVLSSFESEMDDYYFIGHTIVNWALDNDVIQEPLGHYAKKIEVEVLATFLPKKVLEGLFSVLNNSGLELKYLTLEPIASVEAVVPKKLLHLPIALIDIGAGTSDIALIKEGAIHAFGMIPFAGDFITEAVANELLIDFNEAERIKKTIGFNPNSTQISYRDIFGREHKKEWDEVFGIIAERTKELAIKISEEINSLLNTNSGRIFNNYAVVMVGGGALTSLLDKELSVSLSINSDRVGIMTPMATGKYICINSEIVGPKGAVSLGLTDLSFNSPGMAIVHLMVNNRKVELINYLSEKFNVLKALIASGVKKKDIYGIPGLSKTFTLNGELKILKGSIPKTAAVFVNTEESRLDAEVKEGDRIDFISAKAGLSGEGNVCDYLPNAGRYFFNGTEEELPITVTVNSFEAGINRKIEDSDKIEVSLECSLHDIMIKKGANVDGLNNSDISVKVFGKEVVKKSSKAVLNVNGKEIEDTHNINQVIINPGDSVVVEISKYEYTAKDFVTEPSCGKELIVKINNEEFVFPGGTGKIFKNGREVLADEIINDGDILYTQNGIDAEAVLVDVFKYISIDPTDNVGKRLKLKVNEQKAGFTTPLTPNAEVEVGFE